MKIPEFVRHRLFLWASGKITHEKPDFVIGYPDRDYLHRWYVIPRNRWFNIYLHRFLRSDDDRALHDHPWINCSILLKGEYIEWVPRTHYQMYPEDTPIRPYRRREGHIYFRGAKAAHRVQLLRELKIKVQPIAKITPAEKRARVSPKIDIWEEEIPVITLFITGPRIREWGFHCPKGWRPWQEFTANRDGHSTVGKGCE